ALGAALPFTVVLVIDQAEEVFTLARRLEDQPIRQLALAILREAVEVPGDFKLVVSLRTEYFGRLVDRLRRGVREAAGVREYLLTDFDEESLVEAIRRPTVEVPIPYASEVPREKYGFRYAEGVPEQIARAVITSTTNRQDSVLPLVQIVCTQLYERIVSRADRVVRREDVAAIGGEAGGMKGESDNLLNRHLPHRKDRRAFRKLVTKLYLRQPDGTLTTALMTEKDGGAEPKTVEQFWKAIFGDFDPNGSGHGAGQKR